MNDASTSNQYYTNYIHTDIKTRPSWDEYFKKLVLVTSERSPCERLQRMYTC